LKKQTRGLYFHTTFEADPQAVAEIERVMRINEKVLRFQHTRLKENTDLPKYVVNFKEMLAANAIKEKEREAKFQAKRAARAAERSSGFGGEERGDRPERGERGDRGDRGDRGGRERF
jgi:small subunit ribosomal protein S6